MDDKRGVDQLRGAIRSPVSGGTSPREPHAAWVSWKQLEEDLLRRAVPDLEVVLSVPPLTYRGIAELRGLIHRVLPIDFDRDVLVRQNEDGRIVSLRLPMSREWLKAAGSDVSTGSNGPTLEGNSAKEAGKADDSANQGGWGWVKQFGVAIGVMTALLTFVGIAFDLFPALKPEVPPTELAVVVDDVGLEERMTTESGGHVLVVSYGIAFTGYKEDRIHIEWAAFDPQTLARVRLASSVPPSSRNPGNGAAGYVKADAETDRGLGRIEFAAPVEGDCIVIRVYAYDTGFNRLDYGDTPPFHRRDPLEPCDAPTAGTVAEAPPDGGGATEDSMP